MGRSRLRMVVMSILATLLFYTIISHVSPDPEIRQIDNDPSPPELYISSTPNGKQPNPVDNIENIGGDKDGDPELDGGKVVEGINPRDKIQTVMNEIEHFGKEDIEAYVRSTTGTMDLGTPVMFVEVGKINPQPTKKPIKKVVNKIETPMRDPETDPYTRTKLIERSAIFANNSSMYEFIQGQHQRVKNVIDLCKTFEIDTVYVSRVGKRPKINFNNLILDRRNHLTYCPVYKAASTSWSRNLLQLNNFGIEGKDVKTKLQPLIQKTFPKIYNQAGPTLSKDTTRFLVVRHPFERLLSCYRDKFEGARKDYYYLKYGEKMVKMFRKVKSLSIGRHLMRFQAPQQSRRTELLMNQIQRLVKTGKPVHLPHNPFANPPGPTFPEFASYIAMVKSDDEHWRPIHNHCSLCHIEYDFVLRFENLYVESVNFIEYLNRTNEIQPRWDNPTGGVKNKSLTTSEITCSYFNQLTMDIIKNLVTKYKKDFSLFEYSPNDYFKCAKDYKETEKE